MEVKVENLEIIGESVNLLSEVPHPLTNESNTPAIPSHKGNFKFLTKKNINIAEKVSVTASSANQTN